MSGDATSSRNFRLSWSLRTLLCVVTATAVFFGYVAYMRQPHPIVYRVEQELGGNLTAFVEPHDWPVVSRALNRVFGPFERYASPITLIVESDEFTDDDLKAACAIGSTLRTVRIASNRITDDGIAALGKCRELSSIDIESDLVTDRGLASLGKLTGVRDLAVKSEKLDGSFSVDLKGTERLEEIELHGSRIDDRVCKSLKRFERLNAIVLSHTGITDEGLLELRGMRSLIYLNVVDTKVSKKGVTTFRKAAWPTIDLHSDFDLPELEPVKDEG